MKLAAPILALLIASCGTIPGNVESDESAFEVMMSSGVTNYNQSGVIIGAAVFPFTEEFIHALAQRRAVKEKWTDSARAEYILQLSEEHLGEQSDTLTLLLFLHNTQWPCTPPVLVIGGAPKALIPSTMMPCAEPYIADVWKHIYLENEKGVKLPPRLVSPPRHETLTTDEVIWCKFQVGAGAYKWIDRSRNVEFICDLKDHEIRLPIK